MYTLTQHASHTNRDRLWATKRNPNTDIQTIHPLCLGICQSSLGSKPCNKSPQHPTTYTEQRSMNHHWLHTNHLHYKTQVLTLQYQINMRGTQFLDSGGTDEDEADEDDDDETRTTRKTTGGEEI